MGKHGNPGQLNAWASSLGSASSALGAVVVDLKAASPYTLRDASFHSVRVTAGTTHVTVGHYMGYNGNQGAPITKVETKWVTEKVMTGSGVAQNSGSFMTWLPGSVPSFGSTANTWQGYAASMFANLLQDFVNTIEEIQNTIDQLTKSLKAIANSISQSRKWWHILLEVLLPIIAIFVVAVVNFFFPGLGAALLGLISNGLRFLGSIVGIIGEAGVEVAALDAVDVTGGFGMFLRGGGSFSSDASSSEVSSIDLEDYLPLDDMPIEQDPTPWVPHNIWRLPLDEGLANTPGYADFIQTTGQIQDAAISDLRWMFTDMAELQAPANVPAVAAEEALIEEEALTTDFLSNLSVDTESGLSQISSQTSELLAEGLDPLAQTPAQAAQTALEMQIVMMRNELAIQVDARINGLIQEVDQVANLPAAERTAFLQQLVTQINQLTELPLMQGWEGWWLTPYTSWLVEALPEAVLTEFIANLSPVSIMDFLDGLVGDQVAMAASAIVQALPQDALLDLLGEMSEEVRALFLSGLDAAQLAYVQPLLLSLTAG